MQTLFDAGLNPLEVLRSGTINVARFFKAHDRGTIEVGRIADLVLLNDNPLSDISNAEKIEAVIYRGKLLSRQDIDAGLKKIAAKHNSN
jgi:imidazolonepropionase-like amidohydrolase